MAGKKNKQATMRMAMAMAMALAMCGFMRGLGT
jgi:hypothetical protein